MATGELIQIAVGIVLTLTLGAVLWYAWEARKQAKASERIAEAALRPIVVPWAVPVELGENERYTIRFWYRNIGSGPALNMHWYLHPSNGQWWQTPERVGLSIHDEAASVEATLEPPVPDDGLWFVMEYEDVSHRRWKTSLKLDRRDGSVVNGQCKVQRISG